MENTLSLSLSTCCKVHLPQAPGKSQHHPAPAPAHIPAQPHLVQAVLPHLCRLHPGPGMLKCFRASLEGSIPSNAMGLTHLSAAFSPEEQTHTAVILSASMEPHRG